MPVSDAREEKRKRKKKRREHREKENKRSKGIFEGDGGREERHAALLYSGLHIIDYIVYRDLYLGNQ